MKFRRGRRPLMEWSSGVTVPDPVVEASNASGPLRYADQQITSPEVLTVEANRTSDLQLSENRRQTITEDPDVEAITTRCSSHSETPWIKAADDPVVNETGSLLLSEDKWITCPEDPVVKANETGSSLLSKNRPFTFDKVRDITNGFTRCLGKGGFGQVFYGEMPDGTTKLAVKKLFPQSVKLLSNLSKQFENEAQLLMRVHHRNLVPFFGYCQEGDNMALIYEYMAQGDLGSLLGKNSSSKALNWNQRLHIGLDVAKGLEYLHDDCNPPIIHRDIKTANILLNERLEAKIGDFGLSKVFLMYDESSHISTGIKGTEGYIDPEYNASKHLTKKSDVYSFGVVLFQLITALPAIMKRDGTEKVHLVDWANPIVAQKGAVEGVVDPKLEAVHDASLQKAAEIARLCTSEKSEERPTMCEVVAKLKDCLETHAAAKVAFGSL